MLNRTETVSTGLMLLGMMSLASAQTDYTSTLSGTSATPSMSSSTSGSSGGLVAPRTGEYPGGVNGAADNTVDDYTKRGTLIDGKQYFAGWGGNTLVNGAYSFQAIGYDWFGAVNSAAAGNGTWRSGIATSKWAGGVLINFNKTTTKVAAGKSKTVVEGDGFGLFGDFSLGGSDAYGEFSVLTGPGNYTKTPAAENTPTTMHIMGGWKKDATGEGTHSLNAELNYNHYSIENKAATTVKTSGNEFDFSFYHGYILKATPGYSIFLGSKSNFNYLAFDFAGTTLDPDQTSLSIAPNIVFHKDLGHNFEFVTGAVTTLRYFMESNEDLAGVTPTQEGSTLLTANADVNLGLRWVKDNFAVQGSLSETLLQGGPNLVSGTVAPMFGQVSVAIGF